LPDAPATTGLRTTKEKPRRGGAKASRGWRTTPAGFGKLIADETEKWAKVVRFSVMKLE
jgi:hypothetical protein